MITNMKPVQEHLEAIEAWILEFGLARPIVYFQSVFELDFNEVLAVVFELEERGQVELIVDSRNSTLWVKGRNKK